MMDYNFQNSIKYLIIFSQNAGNGISDTPDLKIFSGNMPPPPPPTHIASSKFPPQFSHAGAANEWIRGMGLVILAQGLWLNCEGHRPMWQSKAYWRHLRQNHSLDQMIKVLILTAQVVIHNSNHLT